MGTTNECVFGQLFSRGVSVRQEEGIRYPDTPAFDPSEAYPEYDFPQHVAGVSNRVYALVRQALADLGMDRSAFGTAAWNPFGEVIKPGNTVVIKPNLVLDVPNQDAVTTHASVIRPVIDYVWKALNGNGTIVVCDAPQADADFDRVIERCGLRRMLTELHARNLRVELEDLRALRVVTRNGVWIDEQDLPQARVESVVVDLGSLSAFAEVEKKWSRLHGGGYGRHETQANHQTGRHRYCVSRRILTADALIFLPKLKTHRKAGLTCCLKHAVGINVDKNFLPHFSVGAANQGGDEFPAVSPWRGPAVTMMRIAHDILLGRHWRKTGRSIAALLSLFGPLLRRGNGDSCGKADSRVAGSFYKLLTGSPSRQGAWQGNETIWRMILDLNRLLLFADRQGKMQSSVQRNILYIVDGIIAGEGNGPMNPTSLPLGLIGAGWNGAKLDLAILAMAGIPPDRIPLYREVTDPETNWLGAHGDQPVMFNGAALSSHNNWSFSLKPPAGWTYYQEPSFSLKSPTREV